MSELRRIADQIERWATHDDVMAPGLDAAAWLRQLADSLKAIVDDSELTNFNSDGDELTGCRWCETLWGGHSESCPIGRIDQVLGG